MTKKEPKLEVAFKRLEEIVEELERGDLALEKSLKIFEEGIKLSRFCSSKLDEAEKRIEILMQGEDGKLEAVSWDTGNQMENGVVEPEADLEEESEELDEDNAAANEEAEKMAEGKLF